MDKNQLKNTNLGREALLFYQTDDGQVKLNVRLEDETVWLTQHLMDLKEVHT